MNSKHSDQEPCHNKVYSIIVNGRPREVTQHKLTYLEIVQLAYPGELPSERIVYTVTYSKPNGKEGSLVKGENIKIKNRMIFNVTRTDKS